MAQFPAPVIIAGAGIGGLSAALALAARGIPSRVFERAPELKEVGAGVQLGPNAFRVFSALGLDASMAAISFQPAALRMIDSPTGAELSRQTLGAPFEQRFGQPYRVAYRADVQLTLAEAARARPDLIELNLGDGVIGFLQGPDQVLVHLDAGDTVEGSVLVGADGLWSAIRGELLGSGPPRQTGHVAYRAVVPADAVAADLLPDDVEVWVGPGHHLVCYRLRGGELLNLVAIFESGRHLLGWSNQGDPAVVREAFATACEPVQRRLAAAPEWRAWALYDRDPEAPWSVGRVTLLGDAAHPMLPYLAQGACMAIEDAASLAAELAARPDDVAAALGAYEHHRFPRTASVQLAAREVGAVNHAAGEARERRNAVFARGGLDNYDAVAWLYAGDGPRPETAAGSGVFGPHADSAGA